MPLVRSSPWLDDVVIEEVLEQPSWQLFPVVFDLFPLQDLSRTYAFLLQAQVASVGSLDHHCSLHPPIEVCLKQAISIFDLLLKEFGLFGDHPSLHSFLFFDLSGLFLRCYLIDQ